MNKMSKTWIAAAFLLLGACTTEYLEPNELHSFSVTLTPNRAQKTGSPDKPLGYISGTSCAENPCPGEEECIGYCAVSNHVSCTADDDCPTGEFCSRICAQPIFLDVESQGRDGEPFPLKGERQVHLHVVPGMIPGPYEYLTLTDGKVEAAKIYIAQTFGESYIWVEDNGDGHSPDQYGPCNNELDDDGDGFIDQADPNCTSPDDPREEKASYATGLSPALHFENPRIWHLQYTDQVSTSPLAGQNVFVEKGAMVVTNIIANGFFVTDMDDQHHPLDDEGTPGYYNAFFFYTFNKPEGIGYGDLLCSFTGGVVEYEGNTQMTFPSYEGAVKSEGPKRACKNREIDVTLKVPDPIDVTSLLVPEEPESSSYADQMMENARALEPFESNLIQIKNVQGAKRFIACDSDENGQFPANSDDDACRDECQLDPTCTQLESFFKYSQMSAYATLGKKFFVGIDMLQDKVPLEVPYVGSADLSGNCGDLIDETSGEVLVENPHKILIGDTLFWEYLCPEQNLNSITGNLRHIYLCDPKPGQRESCGLQMTMLVPRFDDDFDFAE
jgi:hypothetical protein